MALIAYERDIPATANNPSVDQPDMKDNTNHIDDIIAVDHYSFNNNNSGWHKQSTMPVLAAIPTKVAGQGVVYTKTANGASNLFYAGDANTDEYQLTRTDTANFATFSTNAGAGLSGWTYLPGGVLMQWGGISASTDTAIAFPVPFSSNVFSIQVTPRVNSNSRIFLWVKTVSLTQFTPAVRDSSGSGDTFLFTWLAIGK